MIYAVLFYEFFIIGMIAVGGGLVTIPFLMELSQMYGWFSMDELTDMIAISEITPGTIGVNMATFAGYKTAGIIGGGVSSIGLSLPAFLILFFFSKYIIKYKSYPIFQSVLFGIRPVAIALISYAGWRIGLLSLIDWKTQVLSLTLLVVAYFWKKSPLIYIVIGGLFGIIFEM